jgi:hypothetical protein
MTGTKAGMSCVLLGPFGVVLAESIATTQGEKVIHENKVSDPARAVLATAARKIASYGMVLLQQPDSPLIVPRENKGRKIEDVAGASDLMLQMQTGYWRSMYFLSHFDNYWVTARISGQLLDVKNHKVLAEYVCSYKPTYANPDKEAPTWAQLYDNGAAGLKVELRKAEDYCINEFAQKVFVL